METLPKQHIRLPALDSLRGCAAVAVVLDHCAYVRIEGVVPGSLTRKLLRPLISIGHPAVLLFFVLSGFVLYINHRNRATRGYWSFIISRFFRIYPAVFVTFVIVSLVIGFFPVTAQSWMTEYYRSTMPSLLEVKDWPRALSLVFTTRPDAQFDAAVWSLVHEMRFSILFP